LVNPKFIRINEQMEYLSYEFPTGVGGNLKFKERVFVLNNKELLIAKKIF